MVQQGLSTTVPCDWLELNWDPTSVEEAIRKGREMGGKSLTIELPKGPDGPAACWLKGTPPGELAEVPYLKVDPSARNANSFLHLSLEDRSLSL